MVEGIAIEIHEDAIERDQKVPLIVRGYSAPLIRLPVIGVVLAVIGLLEAAKKSRQRPQRRSLNQSRAKTVGDKRPVPSSSNHAKQASSL